MDWGVLWTEVWRTTANQSLGTSRLWRTCQSCSRTWRRLTRRSISGTRRRWLIWKACFLVLRRLINWSRWTRRRWLKWVTSFSWCLVVQSTDHNGHVKSDWYERHVFLVPRRLINRSRWTRRKWQRWVACLRVQQRWHTPSRPEGKLLEIWLHVHDMCTHVHM